MLTQLALTVALTVALIGAAAGQSSLTWVNDCSADFARGVEENQALGTVVCVLRAAIGNSSSGVTYAITGSVFFAANVTTGAIYVIKNIDREVNSELDFTLMASQTKVSPPVSASIAHKVTILDVNDNAPFFVGLPYAASVSEAAPPGTIFFTKVLAQDADSLGDNANIELTCQPPTDSACQIFKVSQTKVSRGNFSASLQLLRSVDFEVSPFYVVTLMAQDLGSPRLNRTVNVIVTVVDAQDTPPQFRESFIRFTVTENSTATSTIGTVEARDGDGGDYLGRPVVIEVADDPLGVFEFAPTQAPLASSVFYRAALRMKPGRVLDREAAYGNFYRFNVTATELYSSTNSTKTNASTTTTIEIIISDINDNRPHFVNGPVYNVTMRENLANRSVVPGLEIQVRDADGTSKNNRMAISVISSTFTGTFSVNPSSVVGTGSCNLLVENSNVLDYEEPMYRSQTVVLRLAEVNTTESYSATATVHIALSDANDHAPQFVGNSSYFRIDVSEARPVGWVISNSIVATDADSGAFGSLVYSLSGANADKLAINATTGVLKLARALDYETLREFSVTVAATDGGGLSAVAAVFINVLNFNDKAPFFSQDKYTATLREQSTVLTPPLVLKTNDSDSKSPIKFRIISGNTADNAFGIVNQNSSILNGELVINRAGGFNYSDTPSDTYGRFVLKVLAEDDGSPPLNSTTTVEITLEDINNNPPIFTQKNYSATITETAVQGSLVTTVTATDNDVDAATNKRVTYQLQAGSVDKFSINSLTGEVTVTKTNNFDVNTEGTQFYVQVVARDSGSPVLTDRATVYVTVVDANNKNPVFNQSLYVFVVDEDVTSGTLIGTLGATDVDRNSRLEFTYDASTVVARDPFSNQVTSVTVFNYLTALRLDTNGSLFTRTTLNRDVVAEIQLVATVADKNAELPVVQTATATVVVQIRQKSVRTPVFSAPWTPSSPQILVAMPEGLAVGTTAVTLVAVDPSTNEKVTRFRVIPGSDSESAFSLDESTGTLSFVKVLDYENRVSTRLSVIVEATSPSNATALCTVIVVIQDRNDNSPQFLSSSYVFSVSEATVYPQEFGMVVARDADSGDYGSIRYSLIGTGSEFFILDATLGTLKPAAGVTLDREATAQFNFVVRATDSPSSTDAQRYTDVPLTITLTDVNDNAPVFTNPTFEVSIFENVPAGTVVLTLVASDADAGFNGQVGFAISSGNSLGLFGLGATSGQLRVLASLTGRSAGSPYVLNVTAADGGTPQRMTVRQVTVTIKAITEAAGNPVVTYPAEDGSYVTPEEAPVGTLIMQAQARDPDGTGSGLVFSLRGQDAGKFTINATTGWIANAVRLNREAQSSFVLVVSVKDPVGLVALNPVRFALTLSDVNDNLPVFVGCRSQYAVQPVTVVVPENVYNRQINTFVACDADVSPNNVVRYFITCGNEGGHFSIDEQTGVLQIVKPVDREATSSFTICLFANNTRPYVGAAASANGSRLLVQVTIQDEDDNGPVFKSALQTVYLESSSEFGTTVATVSATDADLPNNWNHEYSILSTKFSSDGTSQSDQSGAFAIDAGSGFVSTKLVAYQSFVGGTFELLVHVVDTQARQSTTTLRVVVVGDENRLRYVLSKPPLEALREANALLANVSAIVEATLTLQKVAHHVTSSTSSDVTSADVCFTLRASSSQLLTLEAARALLAPGTKAELDALYSNFRVLSLGYCNTYSLYKTTDYLGIEGYWWLFIGMASVIIAISAGLAIFVAVLYNRYERMCYALQYQ